MGDEQLKQIARELVDSVRRNATIDWSEKEQVRARMRATIRRLLNRYGYPPDKQPAAIELVMHQAELYSAELVA
jgi:type I restriction enzyme, R subunit